MSDRNADTLVELLAAYPVAKKMKEAAKSEVTAWMAKRANAGEIVQAHDAPGWGFYQTACDDLSTIRISILTIDNSIEHLIWLEQCRKALLDLIAGNDAAGYEFG